MAKRKKNSAARRSAERQARAKAETIKQEQIEEGKAEDKPEAVKEELKTEEPKVEEVSTEESKPEEPKGEEESTEKPEPEEPKGEEESKEKFESEAIKEQEAAGEASKKQESKAEEPKAEEPKAEEPKEKETKEQEVFAGREETETSSAECVELPANEEAKREPERMEAVEREDELSEEVERETERTEVTDCEAESDKDAEPEDAEERRRRLRHQERIERMKREKHRMEMMQRCVIPVAALLIVLIVGGAFLASRSGAESESHYDSVLHGVQMSPQVLNQIASATAEPEKPSMETAAENSVPESMPVPTEEPEVYGPYLSDRPKPPVLEAVMTENTVGFPATLQSEYGVMIDVEEGVILAEKDGMVQMSPASMTKILTVLVAAEELGLTAENWERNPVLDDTFTITIEITDYSYSNDCSCVGFDVGEIVTVRDLFYGTILPSGADAALALALYVSGTHEEFVECMNAKLEEMEISDTTHFTNCVGLYGKEHYSTAYDMAVILKAATENPFCREVLSAKKYNTSPNATHQEGLLISNWFLRRIEDRDTNGEVLCAKTGYVDESRSCAASLAVDSAGKEYLCVTAGAGNSWRCIDDQVALYQRHLPEPQTE